ncbi:right-handed parallel beta-helix repeat-containing protein [Hymenobacter glacieicola]|uniref:Right handed beta helix domain-containing protein n=1 Tax=Hymenobacter glacieicola TaxID=1562124 RepID=A0ABQ1X665_9BACT|nr:right-handed parallel beta-helix repeat-containing protein [Hymenobacter glacieicola]GGG60647.1 hypothetical protein GCM10011378_40840 [Hymenobacter glacieicola]
MALHPSRQKDIDDYLAQVLGLSKDGQGKLQAISLLARLSALEGATPPTGGGSAAQKFTLDYYQGPLPQTYAPLPKRPKPTTGWEGPQDMKPGTTNLVIENRNFTNNDNGGPALQLSNLRGTSLIIRNCNFTGWSPSCLLQINDAIASVNIVVENCCFYGYQTPAGKTGYPGKGIDIQNAVAGNVTIQNNHFYKIKGILVQSYSNTVNTVTIKGNCIFDLQKFDQNGNTDQLQSNGYQVTQSRGVKVDILYNSIFNTLGNCTQQDAINLHGSYGTADRYINIKGNFQDRIFLHPSASNGTGSSITTDNDAGDIRANDPHYVNIVENYTVGYTFGGFNCAGGYLINFSRNIALNTGKLPDGVTGNGVFIGGISIYPWLSPPPEFHRDFICEGNLLGVKNQAGERVDKSPGSGAFVDLAKQLLFPDSFITEANQDKMYHFWRKDAQDAGVAVGLLSV